MTRPPVIRAFIGHDELVVDLFAGGGGASTGIERAIGRSPDIAINHSPEAIALHAANHPTTKHYIENVYKVDSRRATGGRPVALLWLSPDCTHHSKAKGGKPRQQKIRGLAWADIPWAKHARPRVIVLENVEEWLDWGPLHRIHTDGCSNEFPTRTAMCHKGCRIGLPILARKGETFRAWRRKLERYGYVVDHRLMRACDYGAPTTRRRLFLIARRDGRPIVWPAPSHGKVVTAGPSQLELGAREVKPWRTAAEIVDWSIPCRSIFDRERPLADKTMARIAHGIRKYVLEAARPFVIAVNHGGVGRTDHRVHDLDSPMPTITGGQRGGHALVSPLVIKAKTHGGGGNDAMRADEPLRTVTASKRGEFALVAPTFVRTSMHQSNAGCAYSPEEPLRTIATDGGPALAVPYLVHRSNGEREGQAPRIYDVARPLGTIVAQGNKHAVCAAFLAKHYGDRASGGWSGGSALDAPAGTVTAQDHHSLVAAHLTKLYGTSTGVDAREPVPTVTADGRHIGAVAAHLVRYNGVRPGVERVADLEQPIGTQDTSNRFALVAAFLARYNGQSTGQQPDAPIGTLDTTDRYALVTVTIDGEEYAIVDIGMRMLTPPELFAAQGFGPGYVIDPIGPNGKPLTKTAQIRACGNAVPPDFADAIVSAAFSRAA